MRDPGKPQQIVDAAVRVFARNGYYNSRVSDIAREEGIASGTIYLYFKTKDEILVTLFREKMAEWVAQARREVAGEPDAVAKIRRDVPVSVATKVVFGAMDQVAASWVLGEREHRLTEAAGGDIFLQGVSAGAA